METGDNNWAKYWDDAAGLPFYYNSVTGESTYERPIEFRTPRLDNSTALERGDNHWTKYFDEESQLEFYYNDATQEST